MQLAANSSQLWSSPSLGAGSSHLSHSDDIASCPPMAQTVGFAYGKASIPTVSAAMSSLPIPWSFTSEGCLTGS